MRKTEYKKEYKRLVRAGKIKEAKALLNVYRETGKWPATLKVNVNKPKNNRRK